MGKTRIVNPSRIWHGNFHSLWCSSKIHDRGTQQIDVGFIASIYSSKFNRHLLIEISDHTLLSEASTDLAGYYIAFFVAKTKDSKKKRVMKMTSWNARKRKSTWGFWKRRVCLSVCQSSIHNFHGRSLFKNQKKIKTGNRPFHFHPRNFNEGNSLRRESVAVFFAPSFYRI